MNDKKTQWIFRITAALVMFLFGAAFVLSYDALYSLALANGVNQDLAWLWPLGLDAFMVCASLYMLWSHLVKEYEPLPLAIVMVSMCASVIFNVIHAPTTSLARSVAALPPLVAFMAFEILIVMVRHAVENPERHDAPPTTTGAPPATNDATRLTPAARRARLVETRRTMPDATHAMLAQALGVSSTTVARDVAMLDKAEVRGTIEKNGNRQ
jgi:hypothetical protein